MAMARRFDVMLVVAAIALALGLQSAEAQKVHTVGGSIGWTIPPAGAVAYTTWAATQNFTVGDILLFNFTSGAHDVAEVTKAAFNSCNSASTISIANTGPANITLTAAGSHYFICTFSSHCGLGQQLAINVSAASSSSSSPSPSPAPTTSPASTPTPTTSPAPAPKHSTTTPSPASAPTPTPARAAMTYQVGDSMGWIIPPLGAVAYQTWAANKTFLVGDTLVFNFTSGAHDVAEVTKTAYQSCNATTTITKITTSPARITLTAAGEHYFICTFPSHCSLGQKLSINVTGTSTTTATPPSTTTTTPSVTPSPTGSAATPPTPGNSAATSFGSTTGVVSATILSVAVALLF